jgi:hypothetical protein
MRMDSKQYHVYIYFRLDGSPCYVGKGTGNRWLHHDGRKGSSNRHLARIIAKAGGTLPKVKVRDGLTNEQATQIEIAFIKAIGREVNGGPLVNMSDGGEGMAGVAMAADVKLKIALAHKGKPKSAEHRANLSASRRRMFAEAKAAGIPITLSPEHRAAIGAGNKGKKLPPHRLVLLSLTHKGKKLAPDHAAKFSRKGIRQTPEQIAKRVAATRATKQASNSTESGR